MMKRFVTALVAAFAAFAWAGSDTGVRINGLVLGPTTSAKGSSPWTYSSRVLKLTGEGSDYEIWGASTNGDVRIEVACSCTVTIRDLTIDVSSRSDVSALTVTGNKTLTLNLEGKSKLEGGTRGCGIRVEKGNALEITSAEGDGMVDCYGGANAAGIGGNYTKDDGGTTVAIVGGTCGTVTIRRGCVLAQGGAGAAGIGGGGAFGARALAIGGHGGTVRIYGGLVSVYGGSGGAAIGGGSGDEYGDLYGTPVKGGDGGTIEVYGGNLIADGGSNAACLGGGRNGSGGTVKISGGCVRFGTRAARDIGAGYWDRLQASSDSGSLVISGGSVVPVRMDATPVNAAGTSVYAVSIPYARDWASPSLTDLSIGGSNYTYGMADVTTLDKGRLVLWWPRGKAVFALAGEWHTVTVTSGENNAAKIQTTFSGLGGTISYGGKSGSQITLASYTPNRQYKALPTGANVTRSGYAFAGWIDSSGTRVHDSDYVPESSRTLSAQWLSTVDLATAFDCPGRSFTVRRYPGGYASCSWFGQTVVCLKGGSALRTGTIGNNETNVLSHVITGPGTVSFRYRVSSEKNYDKFIFASTAAPSPLLVASGTNATTWTTFSYAVPAGTHTLSWTYAKDVSGACGEDCVWLDDFQWKPAEYYTIRFHKNDGTTVTQEQKFQSGETVTLPTLAKLGWPRRGMDFKGWATSEANATAKKIWKADGASVKDAIAANKTLDVYAVWELSPEAYAIQYVRNDGAGYVRTVGFLYGQTYTLNTIKGLGWERRGYAFKGWATSTQNARDGKVWKTDGASVKNAIGKGQTLTIYAIWELKPGFYEIRFNKNDGTGKWRALGYEYGNATALPTCVNGLGWTRKGYDFAGWATSAANATAGKVWKTDGASVTTAIAAGQTLNVYAIWKPTSAAAIARAPAAATTAVAQRGGCAQVSATTLSTTLYDACGEAYPAIVTLAADGAAEGFVATASGTVAVCGEGRLEDGELKLFFESEAGILFR